MDQAESVSDLQMRQVRVAEILSAFSLATDLGAGQPMGDVLRMCYMAMRTAQEMGLSSQEQADVYSTALLAHAGCTAGASLFAGMIHGDDLAAHRDLFLRDPANAVDILKWMLRHVAAGEPLYVRAQRLAEIVRGREDLEEQILGVCEVAPRLAERLGMSAQVRKALRYRLERWDGRGPQGLRAQDIPLVSRITHLIMVLVPFYETKGLEPTRAAARQKKGTVFDPEVAEAFLEASGEAGFWDELGADDLWDVVLGLEPTSSAKLVNGARIEDVALAFADFADMKTGHKAGHSRGTAAIAVAISPNPPMDRDGRREGSGRG